jgi:hypothetical protein
MVSVVEPTSELGALAVASSCHVRPAKLGQWERGQTRPIGAAKAASQMRTAEAVPGMRASRFRLAVSSGKQ